MLLFSCRQNKRKLQSRCIRCVYTSCNPNFTRTRVHFTTVFLTVRRCFGNNNVNLCAVLVPFYDVSADRKNNVMNSWHKFFARTMCVFCSRPIIIIVLLLFPKFRLPLTDHYRNYTPLRIFSSLFGERAYYILTSAAINSRLFFFFLIAYKINNNSVSTWHCYSISVCFQ